MERLSPEQIDERLTGMGTAWSRQGEAIVGDWKVADFAAALALVNAVGRVAESANHHPDILIHGWNNVRLTLSTHSAGGLTGADFDLAAEIDGLT